MVVWRLPFFSPTVNSFYPRTRLPGDFFRKLANASVWNVRLQEPTARPESASRTAECRALPSKNFLEAQSLTTEGAEGGWAARRHPPACLYAFASDLQGTHPSSYSDSFWQSNSLSLGFFECEVEIITEPAGGDVSRIRGKPWPCACHTVSACICSPIHKYWRSTHHAPTNLEAWPTSENKNRWRSWPCRPYLWTGESHITNK